MELIPITELDKQEICGWHYQGLYQIYNLPSYAEMKVSSMGFASPEKEKNFYKNALSGGPHLESTRSALL